MSIRRVFAALVALVFVTVAFGGTGNIVAAPPGPALAVDEAYEQYVEEYLVGLGTWSGYGFRAAGSTAEDQATKFIEQEMLSIGLEQVRREIVPVDAWDFMGASLTVTDVSGETTTFTASSMGGVPGTDDAGLTGEVIYVDRGNPQNYPADGVEGKLLLVDWDADWVWVNLVGHQATVSGSKGVIISTMSHPSYYEWEDSLGSFDATYDDDWVPLIVISREDGWKVVDMVEQGPVMGTMVSHVTLTINGDGHNVIGVYPGEDHEHPILILGHHDAWFYGASDDTSAIAGMLAWAKAIKEAGYMPEHDLYFIATTGEEYGNTDAYYEWLVGAWYMITQAHPDWAMSAIAFLNIEGLGGAWFDGTSGPFTGRANYELAPLVRKVFAASPSLLPEGWSVTTQLSSWQDGWTLTAAGIPGITFSDTVPGYDAIYHTNMDNLDLIHYDDMAMQVNVMHNVLVEIDSASILPYKFLERASNIAKSVDPKDYEPIGVDVSELDMAIDEFKSLARKYERAAPKLTVEDQAEANALLMEVSQLVNKEWTALSCWDGVIYPTQQVEWDCIWLTEALEFLEMGDLNGALDELWNVGLTWNAFFDYEVWKWENDRHAPGAVHLNWGAQGHLAPYVDIYEPYVSLMEKYEMGGPADYSWEMEELQMVLDSERIELEKRVLLETEQVNQVNMMLKELIGLANT